MNLNSLFGDSNNFAISSEFATNNQIMVDQFLMNVTQIEIVGINIYTIYALLLIIASLVLLSMVAPILIVGKKNTSSEQ